MQINLNQDLFSQTFRESNMDKVVIYHAEIIVALWMKGACDYIAM